MQDGCHCGNLGYQNGMMSAFAHHVSVRSENMVHRRCHLKNSNMSHGGHLEYWNRTIAAFLNVHVAKIAAILMAIMDIRTEQF